MMETHASRVGAACAEVADRMCWNIRVLRLIGEHHDDIEDGIATFGELAHQYGLAVANSVYRLSRREEETYSAYIDRICKWHRLIVVKACDINDNMTRGGGPSESLRRRYIKAWERLERGWAVFGKGEFPVKKAWG